MSEPLSTEPYKGVRDFYPSDWARLSGVFEKTRSVLRSWGYEEYQASPLEPSELYQSKGNEEIIREQTFSFEDRGGRRVTLRPEMTPTLARMVAAKRRELPLPFRWFSIGNRFRYERPQRGRLREFFQTDVDLVGLPEGEADLEVVMLASNIMTSFGATPQDFAIRINSRALLGAACRAVGLTDAEGVRAYWQLLDKKSKMSAEEFEAARAGSKDPLAAVEEATDPEVATEKAKVLALIETLKSRGVTNVSFDPEIVRGFDYYTGMVFEVNDTDPVNPRALFGGGRYDGLVSMFGGDPIPAVGFAFGDVTFLDFLETHNLEVKNEYAPQLFIGTPSPDTIPAAQTFANELRTAGARVFVNLSAKGLGDQIKEADRRGIPLFMAYGADEASGDSVRIKTLATGSENIVAKSDVASSLTK
ncbi:histidine--tRNA ligase [Patescibacteria group bacterium]|nr:histidine--tRNA ligase [Patescibacteria group bacterium]